MRNNTDQNMLDLGHLFIEAQSLSMRIKQCTEWMNLADKDTKANLLDAADKVAEAALMIAGEIDPVLAMPGEDKKEPAKKAKKAKK